MSGALFPPQRRFHMTIDVHADDIETMIAMIRDFDDPEGDPITTSFERTCGGYSGGYHVEFTDDPTMTHDRYEAELAAYLEAKRSG